MKKKFAILFIPTLCLALTQSASAETTFGFVTNLAWKANKVCLAKTGSAIARGGASVASMSKETNNLLNCLPAGSGDRVAIEHLSQILGLSSYLDHGIVRGANEGIIKFMQNELNTNTCFAEDYKQFKTAVEDFNNKTILDLYPKIKNSPLKARPSLNDRAGNAEYKNVPPGWIWDKAMQAAGQDAQTALRLINICGNDDAPARSIQLQNGETVECLERSGPYFVSGSLGAQYDISNALKKRIVDTQYPGAGATYAPSKYYHVYTSAFLTCELISKGMPKDNATEIVKLIFASYRAMRVKESVDELNGLQITYENSTDKKISFADFVKANKKENVESLYGTDDPARVARLMEAQINFLDVAFLVNRWQLGTRIPVFNIPLYTNIKITDANKKDKPPGWSDERFANALKRLQTLIIDEEWTSAQSEVGAKFAADHCAAKPSGAAVATCSPASVPAEESARTQPSSN